MPQGLYGGGAYGLCQVIRTLLETRELSASLPFDLAGVLYLLVNMPMFFLAYRALGREFFWKAAICTVCNSVFLAVIPSPSTPSSRTSSPAAWWAASWRALPLDWC